MERGTREADISETGVSRDNTRHVTYETHRAVEVMRHTAPATTRLVHLATSAEAAKRTGRGCCVRWAGWCGDMRSIELKLELGLFQASKRPARNSLNIYVGDDSKH